MRPYSSTVLTLGGVILIGLGVYFLALRPPLLVEDLRYMSASGDQVAREFPGLLRWLPRVFAVLGGYILTTGLLTVYLARTAFRARAAGAWIIVAFAGLASLGWMTIVNFLIASDFRWLLAALFLPWPLALFLYRLERPHPLAGQKAKEP